MPATTTRPNRFDRRGESATRRAYAYIKERLLDGRFAGGTLLSENELGPAPRSEPHTGATGVRAPPGRGPDRALPAARRPRRPDLTLRGRGRARGAAAMEPHCARRGSDRRRPTRRRARARHRRPEGGARHGRRRLRDRRPPLPSRDRRRRGNPLLTRQYDSLRDRHRRIAAATVASDPGRIERFIAEHSKIAAALRRGTQTPQPSPWQTPLQRPRARATRPSPDSHAEEPAAAARLVAVRT